MVTMVPYCAVTMVTYCCAVTMDTYCCAVICLQDCLREICVARPGTSDQRRPSASGT